MTIFEKHRQESVRWIEKVAKELKNSAEFAPFVSQARTALNFDELQRALSGAMTACLVTGSEKTPKVSA